MRIASNSDITFWSAGAVLLILAALSVFYTFGASAGHMAAHIALMNVVAPVVATFIAPQIKFDDLRPIHLWMAATVQIVLLWSLHAPGLHAMAVAHLPLNIIFQALLFAVALAFWLAVLMLNRRHGWQSLLALALTGKLVCLLAALLVFAPRALYSGTAHGHAASASDLLGDQHLAGLMMIVACPASYLTAAVILAVRLLLPSDQPHAEPVAR